MESDDIIAYASYVKLQLYPVHLPIFYSAKILCYAVWNNKFSIAGFYL